MGADIYIDGLYQDLRKRVEPDFRAAVADRNRLGDAIEAAPDSPEETAAYDHARRATWMGMTKDALAAIAQHHRVAAYVEAQGRCDAAYNALNAEEVYFRDGYNNTGLFQYLDLSWWDLASKLERDFRVQNDDESLVISVAGVAVLREIVANAVLTPPSGAALAEQYARFVEDGHSAVDDCPTLDDYVAQSRDFFERKHARLIRFLDTAIAADRGILMSV